MSNNDKNNHDRWGTGEKSTDAPIAQVVFQSSNAANHNESEESLQLSQLEMSLGSFPAYAGVRAPSSYNPPVPVSTGNTQRQATATAAAMMTRYVCDLVLFLGVIF